MKTKYHIFFLVLAAIALFATACNNDDLTNDKGDPAVISLTLNNVQTRGGDLFAGDALITKVRIYVFNGNYVDAMRVYDSGTDEFTNPFRIKTTTGAKTVYVVANEPAGMTAALNGITTLSALQALITPETNAPLSVPLTMVGSENVIVKPSNTQVTVPITRLATMLNLTVKKGESTTDEIILKGVRLFRIPAKSALIEGQPVTGQNYWNYTYTLPTPTPLTTDGIEVWTPTSNTMYLYENPGSVADTLNRATYIIIDAVYNGVNTRYSAYLNDDKSDAVDHNYSIKRNHQYNLTATITKVGEIDGLLLQIKVLPWELIESTQTFDETPPVINPIEGLTVDNNTTSIANPLTFNFTLTDGPQGAVWEATLDNGLEFGFEDIANTKGTLGEEKTITIKPLKPFNASVERTTHFYITVTDPANGIKQKIPLVQGSDATQILITQVEN